jgi:hypothetical protein
MSEFETGGGYGAETTEIYLKRVLPGSIETVRARLSAAMERIGYDVIEEEPTLRGRRGVKGWGTWYGSADVMDYATTLVIRFKAINPHQTRATFDYTIAHQWLQKGEKEVLVREAEAIVALASPRAADKICMACGTETLDDSRFCRRCGAPLTSEQNTLDLLRMTAESRAAHSSVVTSAIMLLVTNILTFMILIMTWAGAFASRGLWRAGVFMGIALAIIGLFNLIITRFAWNRLNDALRLRPESAVMPTVMRELPQVDPAALPPPSAGFSITEGTTELLGAQRREPVPVERDKRDTDAIN